LASLSDAERALLIAIYEARTKNIDVSEFNKLTPSIRLFGTLAQAFHLAFKLVKRGLPARTARQDMQNRPFGLNRKPHPVCHYPKPYPLSSKRQDASKKLRDLRMQWHRKKRDQIWPVVVHCPILVRFGLSTYGASIRFFLSFDFVESYHPHTVIFF
jgi:hypothetical protein